ncbi:hypothetical protein BDQ17DRAFT_933061 [Cyathus striatus]|nr:hypothetical protein BDQ17DRAFT_933061 [Cyathus striatus]
MFVYELPTTGAISFSDFFIDQSTHKTYTYHIPQATQARADLRDVLKESKRTEHAEKDFLRLVKLIEEYIPYLRGIMACVAHDEIGCKAEPIFSWRTTLSSNLFHTSPRLSVPGLHADYAFTLLTFAFALSNLAHTVVSSLGNYESERAISDEERKRKDEQLNVAVGFLCKASGIFTYVSDTVLPEWEVNRSGGPPGFNKPPELSREINNALAKMALADAQALAIRKLLSKSAYDINIAPGPPLPTSHPSPALLAKLHLECASLYSSAHNLAKTFASLARSKLRSPMSEGSSGEVNPDLRKYLSDENTFHDALARKWLGVDAGEHGGTARGGEAVAFIAWAKKDLEDMREGKISGAALTRGDKEKDIRGKRRDKINQELETVTVFLKHYKRMNDSLHFQPVPTQPDLQSRIPAGRMAVASRPFTPPQPAFGPGSVEYIRKEAERLEVTDQLPNVPSNAPSDVNPSQPTGNYAGAGAYF